MPSGPLSTDFFPPGVLGATMCGRCKDLNKRGTICNTFYASWLS